MNRKTPISNIICLIAGLLGAWLYWLIFATSWDEMDLIVRGSLPEIALWALTACAAVYAIVASRGQEVESPKGIVMLIGDLVFAVGVYTLATGTPKGPAPLVMAYRIVAWAAAASLAVEAILAAIGRKPHFLLTVAPALLGILQLVECYQLWSEKPLLLDYAFGLGAVLCLMLFAYQRMAKRSALPVKALYPFTGLAGIFFCCVAAVQGEFPIFFGAAAIWLLAETTAMGPKPIEEATDAAA